MSTTFENSGKVAQREQRAGKNSLKKESRVGERDGVRQKE